MPEAPQGKPKWWRRLFGKHGTDAAGHEAPALETDGEEEPLRAGIAPPDNLDEILAATPRTFEEATAESVRVPDIVDAPVTFTIEKRKVPVHPNHADKVPFAYCATRTGTADALVIGYEHNYSSYRGVSQDYILRHIPALKYDRFAEEKTRGLWAHFIWPTVVAESAEYHLRINTYDGVGLTFGFYQLAAHTPDDNLILLFRELLKLPLAQFYFPDLTLLNGKVAKKTASGPRSLERTAVPPGKTEARLPDFITYFNPAADVVEDHEVVNAAKLMHWVSNDAAALQTSTNTAFAIMRKKLAGIARACPSLKGQEPELAIWASDIRHQGRGGIKRINEALSRASYTDKVAALFEIDHPGGRNLGRRQTVRACIEKLKPQLKGIKFGEGPLAL